MTRRSDARPKGIVRLVALPAALFAGSIVALKAATALLDHADVINASTPMPVVLLGVIIGMTYGLLGVGLVLVYRASHVINFAHGQIGAFGAALFGLATVEWGVPYWVAFPLALAVAALTGASAETGVVRRLRAAPRIMSVVATLGVAQFLIILAAVINSNADAGQLYPQPSGMPTFSIGALQVTSAYSAMLLLSPLVVISLALFLKRSRVGLAIRASAANRECARMSGIFAGRMSAFAWAIAGGLSAFTAILTAPTQGFISGDTFGPALLLRAMTAAVVGRMQSLPAAVLGGIGLGVVEQLLLWNYPRSGLVEPALFGAIIIALLLQQRRTGRDAERGNWAAVEALRPIPSQLRALRSVRALSPAAILILIAVLAAIPLLATNRLSVTFTGILCFAIVGLSVGVLTGLSGQLTLGQFAVAAIGAVVSLRVGAATGDFPLALLLAGLSAGAVSVLLGLPSLRTRGPMLTVTTLGFALAVPSLLAKPWLLGAGKEPSSVVSPVGGTLDTGRKYYYLALVIFLLCLALAHTIRRSGFGRLLIAIRDNEDNARAFAVPASRVRLQGYLVAGFIAGIGGAVYAQTLSSVTAATFPVSASISVVVMTVLGGVSMLCAPLLGAVWVLGIPLLNIGNIGLAATNLGALLMILWRPGGLAQIIVPIRDRIVARMAFRKIDDFASPAEDDRAAITRATVRTRELAAAPGGGYAPEQGPILVARNLGKRFGGVVAVDDVSFEVAAGETVGLIGPNGAGKTTTFELLSGFTRPDRGQVQFRGTDVSKLGPGARAKVGLIRSFQDAALFPTMTVQDAVMLAFERTHPTNFAASVIGLRLGERKKSAAARSLVSAMGLESYQDTRIHHLSTGTRRITELACLVALEPVCLLLDEPSSGIAQRETEALGELLVRLRDEFNLTLLVIEHDIPLIMDLSDRIIAMADGRIIADGPPDVVRSDSRVTTAYLGGEVTAIHRSDSLMARPNRA